ncbi:MAG: FKBP-type peptidyl-prolyl cis-trans isomerase [Candidatus Methanoperedens sp.]|nr:FKBP-type peptidyl-prolyl cis-trans isomerase [Candidatus Methanoperedens sp.]
MKKFLILLLAAAVLFSGCLAQKTVKTEVKNGDNISVDYIGSLPDGKVFDTSNEKVAIENNVFAQGRIYKPLNFTVGKGKVIKGLDEGVVGMKIGESRTLRIPPEKAYGLINPVLMQIIPVIENISATQVLPKVLEVPRNQFESTLGPNHNIGEIVTIPGTNINMTILNITSNVSVSYNLKLGDNIWQSRAPWNETVIKIDEKNITIKANVSKNEIIQLQGAPWNTTVVGLNNVNITLRHNPIPDTVITTQNMFGQMIPMKVSFNETSIIMDQNPEFAGKTLIFNVTLKSIQ